LSLRVDARQGQEQDPPEKLDEESVPSQENAVSPPATSNCSSSAAAALRLMIRLAASHRTSPTQLTKQFEVVGNQYYTPRT